MAAQSAVPPCHHASAIVLCSHYVAFIPMLGGSTTVLWGEGAAMPSVSHLSFNFDRSSFGVQSADWLISPQLPPIIFPGQGEKAI